MTRRGRLALCGLTACLVVFAASALRFDVLASPAAPPSPDWGTKLSSVSARTLQNVPVVVSAEHHDDGLIVTVANRGSTTLSYYAAGRSGVQLFQELEQSGCWTANAWDWCGMGKEHFELPPDAQVRLRVEFWDPRRERMLASFTEKGTLREGLVVLAAENRQVSADIRMLAIQAGVSTAAVCAWLLVRIVNRRGSARRW